MSSAPTQLQGFLLTRHWRDTPDGVELVFWAASEQGPLRLRVVGQQAVCFIDREQEFPADADVSRRAVELCRLSGDPVDALYFAKQRTLTRYHRDAHWRQQLCESDIKPTDRFLMERFVRAGFSVRNEFSQRDGFIEINRPALKPADYRPSLKIASIDIETQGLTGPLYSIAAVCGECSQVFMIGTEQDHDRSTPRYHLSFHADEAALLRAFFDWLADCDPDVLIGWNVIDFDLDYLDRKCRELNLPLALGRGGESAAVLQPQFERQPRQARLPGRVVLDGIDLLRAGFWSFERFSLDHVARELLGEGKLLSDASDKVAAIDQLFRDDKPALAEYNWVDCQRVVEIFAKANLIDFAVQRAALTGLAIDRLGGAVAAFDNLYLPRLHRQGYVAPNVASGESLGEGSPGGYVLDSRPGLYDNVLVLDFKSLYPSIIRTFLIDPLGLAEQSTDSDPVPGYQGGAFARERHILPGLISELWRHRDAAKQQRDAPLSQAIKIIMNSFYGVLGTSRCRFYDARLASSITRRGHDIITRSRDYLQDQAGREVIYGDTDSLFVLLGPNHSEAQARDIGAELAGALNDWWTTELTQTYQLQSALEVEFERHFLRFFMPTVRGSEAGSKKRYAGTVRAAEGVEPELVIKGLEAARTDWTPLARSFQRELYQRVFAGQPYEDFIRDTAEALLAGHKDHELVYRKALRRKLSDYQRNVPPHVQAARKQKQATSAKTVEYLMTVHGPEPLDNIQSPPDYQHYMQRQLAPAADGILQFLGCDFAGLTDAQTSLF